MRKFLAVTFVLALLAAVGYGVYSGLQSPPPDAAEIYAVLENRLPQPARMDDPELTDKLTIRGWRVWIGNYRKYDKRTDYEIDRIDDVGDKWRNVRIFRRTYSAGSRVAWLWLFLTGSG